MKKYYTYNLGCRVNSYELSVVEQHLLSLGYINSKKTDKNIDVIVINTCSVTSVADSKSRKMIKYFRRNNPLAKIMVMGCFVEGNPEFDYSDADVYVGTSKRKEIIKAIDDIDYKYCYDFKKDPDVNNYEYFGITPNQYRRVPEIKIEDGCNAFCSYCRICYIRGRVRSRNKDDIFAELDNLTKHGKNEFIFTGINLGEYGLDLDGYRLANLLKDVLMRYPSIIVHLSSLELTTLTDNLIAVIKDNESIDRHLHIPLQSGSSNILKLMNRKFSQQDYLNKINTIKEEIPSVTFSTDVIVGFPGETDEDFKQTVKVAENVGFSHIHIFPYSIRPGTPAATMPNHVDDQVKKERCNTLKGLKNR